MSVCFTVKGILSFLNKCQNILVLLNTSPSSLVQFKDGAVAESTLQNLHQVLLLNATTTMTAKHLKNKN